MNFCAYWLKNWLVFCSSLFVVYIIYRIFVWFIGIMWIRKIRKKNLIIRKSGKFNKNYKNKISYSKMKEIINGTDFRGIAERPAWFELFDAEKILFFAVPWGEIYCECTEDQYKELIEVVKKRLRQIESIRDRN